MQRAELLYLTEVLGVEGFIRPRETNTDRPSRVVAVTDAPLVNGRAELLQKMLASIGVHEFVVCDIAKAESVEKLAAVCPSALVYLGGAAYEWQKDQLSHIQSVRLPSLVQLTDTTDPAALQQLKKATWVLLQTFQKEVECAG